MDRSPSSDYIPTFSDQRPTPIDAGSKVVILDSALENAVPGGPESQAGYCEWAHNNAIERSQLTLLVSQMADVKHGDDCGIAESYEDRPPATAAGVPTPFTADLRMLGSIIITAEELLAYFPKHLISEPIVRRLHGNGWEAEDICAAVNYFRNWTKDDALLKDKFVALIWDLERRNQSHNGSSTSHDDFYPLVWDFTVKPLTKNYCHRKLTNNLLTDLVNGLVARLHPTDKGAGMLTRCIVYAEKHPQLGLRLSDVQHIIQEQNFQDIVTDENANIDFEALDRHHNILHMREYRYPLGNAPQMADAERDSYIVSPRKVAVKEAIRTHSNPGLEMSNPRPARRNTSGSSTTSVSRRWAPY